jgi:hypothetical protein
MNDKRAAPYRAFLIRWWEVDDSDEGERGGWRFSYEEVGSDRPRLGFTSTQELADYLQADLCAGTPATGCAEEESPEGAGMPDASR